MKICNKDQEILKKIVKYCEDIENTVRRFGDSYSEFSNDGDYRNSCTMCILQIGELSKHLSEETKEQHKEIPWGGVRAMRNVIAHNYGNVDFEDAWDTIKYDIPILKRSCEKNI